MVVKVVGGRRQPNTEPAPPSLFEDPDPQQLVMAWDQEAQAKRAKGRAQKGSGAEKKPPAPKKPAKEAPTKADKGARGSRKATQREEDRAGPGETAGSESF